MAAMLATRRRVAEQETRRRTLDVALVVAKEPTLQAAVPFLAVHIEGARLAPRLANKTLQVVVELESEGSSLRQQVGSAQSDALGNVHFGLTCKFPWFPGMDATLRVRLSKVGFLSKTVANKEVQLPTGIDTEPWQSKHDLVLLSNHSGRFVGDLHLNVELEAVSLWELYGPAEGGRSGH